MFQFKELLEMTRDELLAEEEATHDYLDRLVGLGHTLGVMYHTAPALSALYAGQKGHEIFMMALNVVEQCCEVRARAVAARCVSAMSYYDQILDLLGLESISHEEWPSYEMEIDAESKPLSL